MLLEYLLTTSYRNIIHTEEDMSLSFFYKRRLLLITSILFSFICKFCVSYLPLNNCGLRRLHIEDATFLPLATRWRKHHRNNNDYCHIAAVGGGNQVEEPLVWTKKGYRRPLHFVLKIGNLRSNLKFFEQFGYTLFRHEVSAHSIQ